MVSIIYTTYNSKGEETGEQTITLEYHDHAILLALFGILISRTIKFKVIA